MVIFKAIMGVLLGLTGYMWLDAEMQGRPEWKMFFIFFLIFLGGSLFGNLFSV